MFKKVNRRVLDTMLGFAAGVMIAASYWSLLAPCLEMLKAQGKNMLIPSVGGFLVGGIFLRVMDRILPHLDPGLPAKQAEGIHTRWRRSVLLVMAITLHNIPEGLAIGVAFGAVAYGMPSATLGAAVALAIGIGIQNFPEGLAVSAPLRSNGFSRLRAFWYGQLSGLVEPISAVAGAAAVLVAQPLLPWALSFAAGAMIFVVVEQLIPDSQRHGNTDLATMGAMSGFALMMLLDVGLG
jgi:ZIP family zinc transporter